MHELELELIVGDVVQVGDYVLTVIDADGDDVSFRVDSVESQEAVMNGSHRSSRPGK